jgi:oligopeptide transport system permease protein
MPTDRSKKGESDDDLETISAIRAPQRERDNPLTRSIAGMLGMGVLIVMFVACLGSLPWTLSSAVNSTGQSIGVPRYDAGSPKAGRLPPSWWAFDDQDIERSTLAIEPALLERIAIEENIEVDELLSAREGPLLYLVKPHWPSYWLGSDTLGRSLGVRLLAGGGISLTIGIAAALISVSIGTAYGALAAYIGGKVDSVMMRVVDVLYGLPYILLVVLLAVASDAMIDEWVTHNKAKEKWIQIQVVEMQSQEAGERISRADARQILASDASLHDELMTKAIVIYPRRELSAGTRTSLDVLTLLVAIGGVSWLTMARVIRGQVLSLKNQQFVEAARAIGGSPTRIFVRHLLPNLIGPIVVYATLAVPQAILQESFLSFLGIGVKPPLPSWGNLAAEGLGELNTYRSHWWLLFFPCLLLGVTLLAMNFVGEGLREAFDPKRQR